MQSRGDRHYSFLALGGWITKMVSQHALRSAGDGFLEMGMQSLVSPVLSLWMDREAWRAAVHGVGKESNMTERLN